MKKLLALVLSMLLVASCLALVAIAEEETTAATETTSEESTTEQATPTYSNTLLVFDDTTKAFKILGSPSQIDKHYYSTEDTAEPWEGAKLLLKDITDPYVFIQWNSYISKAKLDKVDSQEYPFVVIKLKVDGYVEDFELFYCAGTVSGADQNYATTTDYPHSNTGDVEYIIYDLTDDCEGNYNSFRFDPVGADEESIIYLYEFALFKTEEEALAYAEYDEEQEDDTTAPVESEQDTTAPESEEDEEIQTAAPVVDDDKKEGCGSVISVTALAALITLGAVCIKKKD